MQELIYSVQLKDRNFIYFKLTDAKDHSKPPWKLALWKTAKNPFIHHVLLYIISLISYFLAICFSFCYIWFDFLPKYMFCNYVYRNNFYENAFLNNNIAFLVSNWNCNKTMVLWKAQYSQSKIAWIPFRYLPLANILGLLVVLKHMLCRIRSARCWLLLCLYLHISTIWSKNPFIFIIICCPSSPKDMFSSSFSQRVDTLLGFLLLPFGNERDKKFCRKLLCQKEEKRC